MENLNRSLRLATLLYIILLLTNHTFANGWIKDYFYSSGFFSNNNYIINSAEDSGFYALSFYSDTIQSQCGADSCNRNGFYIIKYNSKGNIVWQQKYLPPPNLLEINETYPCNLTTWLKYFKPIMITNTNDNSGIIVRYDLIAVTWGWCFCLECVPVENYITTYYAKFDYNGNLIWSGKEFNNRLPFDKNFYTDMFEITNNHNQPYYLQTNISNKNDTVSIVKDNYNSNLEFIDLDSISSIIDFGIDTNYINYSSGFFGNPLLTADNATIYTINHYCTYKATSLQFRNYSLVKINANNEIVWNQLYTTNTTEVSNVVEHNNRYYWLHKMNQDSSVLLSIDNDGLNSENIYFKTIGNFLYLREANNHLQFIGIDTNRYQFVQFTESNEIDINKIKSIPVTNNDRNFMCYYSPSINLKNGSTVFGMQQYHTGQFISYLPYIMNIDPNGNIYNAALHGTVVGDKNDNCIKDSTDAFLRNYALRTFNNTDTFYTSTGLSGNYSFYLDTGSYQLQLLTNENYPLWENQNCTFDSNINLGIDDSVNVDIKLTPLMYCEGLVVNLSTSFLRRCFPNNYTVNFCNNGTKDAVDAYIDITLDNYLHFDTSSIAVIALGNNLFRFFIDTIKTGECNMFTFTATVNCDSSAIGQVHCTEAHIFPDTVCLPNNYNGAIIRANAICNGDSIQFMLKNIGNDMQSPKKYIVIQDQVLRISQNYQLANNEEKIIKINKNFGRTFRIIAEQENNFPYYLGDNFVTAFTENCSTNTDTAYINNILPFPTLDGEPYRALDCQANITSFDPNEKNAVPIGVKNEHYIEANTPLVYTINFQNKGYDTAFTISIIDTISQYLDINSIRLYSSSHLCSMKRIDSNVIQFLFENILLPHESIDTLGSQGYVQYQIRQKPNNNIGTVIYNSASIYFDFNLPIITNTTYHTIGKDFLEISLINNAINELYSKLKINLFPNPFRDFTILTIENVKLNNPSLIIYNLQGNIVQNINTISNHQFYIYRQTLPAGIYLYKLLEGSFEVANGKMVIQ